MVDCSGGRRQATRCLLPEVMAENAKKCHLDTKTEVEHGLDVLCCLLYLRLRSLFFPAPSPHGRIDSDRRCAGQWAVELPHDTGSRQVYEGQRKNHGIRVVAVIIRPNSGRLILWHVPVTLFALARAAHSSAMPL